MAIPLLAMALGGAALGALANPEDRKKGALLGLGAGLLGPAVAGAGAAGAAGAGTAAAGTAGAAGAAGAGAAGAGAAGGLAAGGAGTAAGTAAGAAGAGTAATQAAAAGAPIVEAGMTTGALNANAAQLAAQQGAAAGTSTGAKVAATTTPSGPLGKVGAWMKKEVPGVAKDVAKSSIVSALTQEGPKAPVGGSHAVKAPQQQASNPYARAAMNQQARMKKRAGGGKRFI